MSDVTPVPDWHELGLCRQTDPEVFFPEKGGSALEAKRICGMCSESDVCLEGALERGERFGIWGGLTERERRRIRGRMLRDEGWVEAA